MLVTTVALCVRVSLLFTKRSFKKNVIFVCLFMSYSLHSLQVTRLRFSFAKGS